MAKTKGKKAGGPLPAAAAAAAAKTGGSSGASSSSLTSSFVAFAAAIVVVAVAISMLGDGGGLSGAKPAVVDNRMDHTALPGFQVGDNPLKSVSEIRARAKTLPCKNKHADEECHNFASMGHCHEAPGWMIVFCAASCNACELRDPDVRCDAERIGYENNDIWAPGSVDSLFETIQERWPQFNVSILSRPPEGPWVAKFHNFVNQEEIDALIDMTGGNLRRSTDQGSFGEDGVQEQVTSKGRTSMNAWCVGKCEEHPLIRGVSRRIAEVTGVPEDNYESFQILRYDHNQEYVRHHDMSPADNALLSGPRILTFYLYLSDVEEGGGTQFTDLDPPLTNHPEKGTAILWPSVLNEDPTKIDQRTHHAALPVVKGTKFGANHWIHLRNYRIPNLMGCTGSFDEY